MREKLLDFWYIGTHVSIRLDSRYTFIDSDSGTGKTYFYNLIDAYRLKEEIAGKYTGITCINREIWTNIGDNIIDKIKANSNGIVVIDSATEIFNSSERIYDFVWNDLDRYYLIFGRSIKLNRGIDEIADIIINKDSISIEYWGN